MTRDRYPTRRILLRSELQREIALKALATAPLDSDQPLELVLREEQKARGLDANARMWVGPLADIAEQAYVNGRTFSAEVWHEWLKKEFLPEDFDPEFCKDGYRKWDYDPAGNRVLVGSTTKLTKRGFARYLKAVEAYAQTELGVQLHASPSERNAA